MKILGFNIRKITQGKSVSYIANRMINRNRIIFSLGKNLEGAESKIIKYVEDNNFPVPEVQSVLLNLTREKLKAAFVQIEALTAKIEQQNELIKNITDL